MTLTEQHRVTDVAASEPPAAIAIALYPHGEWVRFCAALWIPLAFALAITHLRLETVQGLTAGNATYAFGDDTIKFWSGARLVLLGRAGDIYNFAVFHRFEQAVLGGPIQMYFYGYPPPAALLTLPLGLLPYLGGWFCWVVGGWVVFILTVRAAWPRAGAAWRDCLLYGFAVPALLLNNLGGQNGTWFAAVMGGGLILLERRPILAGALLGLLVAKPQLGLLVPVALLAGRHWRALAAMAISAMALCLISIFVLGFACWLAFLMQATYLRHAMLEQGPHLWPLIVSVFDTLRHLPFGLSLSMPWAYAGQAVVTLMATVLVALTWSRDGKQPEGGQPHGGQPHGGQPHGGQPGKIAVLLLCGVLAKPYMLGYDLVIASLAPLFLAQAVSAAHPRFAYVSCLMLLLAPVISLLVGDFCGIAIGVLMVIPAVFAAWRAGETTLAVPPHRHAG